MYTVKDGQQDFGQTQQVTEVVEAKVNEIPCQINNLQQNQTKKQKENNKRLLRIRQLRDLPLFLEHDAMSIGITSNVSLFFSLSEKGTF